MTTFNWLSLFGVPAIVFAAIAWAYSQFKKMFKANGAEKLGIQALLRDSLERRFEECQKQGYATQSARRNFENMYTQYHNLGANGVMDDTRAKFLALPIGDED